MTTSLSPLDLKAAIRQAKRYPQGIDSAQWASQDPLGNTESMLINYPGEIARMIAERPLFLRHC